MTREEMFARIARTGVKLVHVGYNNRGRKLYRTEWQGKELVATVYHILGMVSGRVF